MTRRRHQSSKAGRRHHKGGSATKRDPKKRDAAERSARKRDAAHAEAYRVRTAARALAKGLRPRRHVESDLSAEVSRRLQRDRLLWQEAWAAERDASAAERGGGASATTITTAVAATTASDAEAGGGGDAPPSARDGLEYRMVTADRAKRVFLLDDGDLDGLYVKERRNPYDEGAPPLRMYRLGELKAACLARWGSLESASQAWEEAIDARETELRTLKKEDAAYAPGRQSVFAAVIETAAGQHMANAETQSRAAARSEGRRQRVVAREGVSGEGGIGEGTGTKAVVTAVGTNALLFVAKTVAFVFSGSASMLSEAVHSFADVANQCLLMVGLREASKAGNDRYPYGFSNELYVWSLISAAGIFFVGGGVGVYHGVSGLMHPEPLEHLPLAMSVLGGSLLLEGYSMSVAYKEIKRESQQAGMTISQYIRDGPDPMNVAVLAEDLAAVAGVGVAGACLGLSYYTGNLMWDSVGSIAVGCLLGAVAVFLVQRNRTMLVGVSLPLARVRHMEDVLLADPVVDSVHDIKAIMTGSASGRFKVEIAFNAAVLANTAFERDEVRALAPRFAGLSADDEATVQQLLREYSGDLVDVIGDEIDRLEDVVRQELPEISHVDIEVV